MVESTGALMLMAVGDPRGASGVAGGSLLLIPMATSLLGIPADVAMQVVAIGFVISVVQDSAERAQLVDRRAVHGRRLSGGRGRGRAAGTAR